MNGHELLKHAASLGPGKGMVYLAQTFNKPDGPMPTEFLKAVQSYRDPETMEFRLDTPEDIVALAEEARVGLLG